MKGDYVTKSIRFHKEDDKELLEKISEFCAKRKFSEKTKEVLKDYFNIWELNNKKILDSIEDLKNMIRSGGFAVGVGMNSSNPTMSKTDTVISIDDLMKNSFEESSDDDLF